MKKEVALGKVKAAASFVGSCSIEAAICGFARALLPPGVNLVLKGGMLAGGLLIGAMFGEKLDDFVDRKVDSTVKEVEDTISEIKRCVDVIQDKTEENNTEEERG